MSQYELEAESSVETDIEDALEWYEIEQLGLGVEFLEELRAAYLRILDGPFKYQELRSGIRRSLTRRFPYAVYFSVEGEVVLVLAVLQTARDPEEWQLRIGGYKQ